MMKLSVKLCAVIAALLATCPHAFQFAQRIGTDTMRLRRVELLQRRYRHVWPAFTGARSHNIALSAKQKAWYELAPGELPEYSGGGGGEVLGPPPDLPSMLLDKRMVYVPSIINPQSSEVVIAQLLYLNNENTDAPINIYINSLGGDTNASHSYSSYYDTAAFAIVDTMRYIHCPVHTSVVGQAHGSAALILAAGAKGHRSALSNSAISLRVTHPPISGRLKYRDIFKSELALSKKAMADLIAEACGKEAQQVLADIEGGPIMTAKEAQQYGLVDKIESPKVKTRPTRAPTSAFLRSAEREDRFHL